MKASLLRVVPLALLMLVWPLVGSVLARLKSSR